MLGERLYLGGGDQRLDARERLAATCCRDRPPTRSPSRARCRVRVSRFTTPTSCRRTAPIGFAFEQDLRSRAARGSAREMNHEPPPSGVRPTRAYDITNLASSAATIRSHASASEKPAPAAAPSTAAITGFDDALQRGDPFAEQVDALGLHRRIFRAVLEQAVQVAARAEEVVGAGHHDGAHRVVALGGIRALRCRRRTCRDAARCFAPGFESLRTSVVSLSAGRSVKSSALIAVFLDVGEE